MRYMRTLLIAAEKSGSGKTTLTCGLLKVLKDCGIPVLSFKCGPDYIDPMFHEAVLGIKTGNLDSFMSGDTAVRDILMTALGDQEKGSDAAEPLVLLEGAMGYFDGLCGISEKGSAAEIAGKLNCPVVLVLDAKGSSVTLAAVLRGLLSMEAGGRRIKGVILNRVSPMFYPRLRALLEEKCRIPVLGYLPEKETLRLPSRHLGLVVPEEITFFRDWISTCAEQVKETVSVDRLLALAEKLPVTAESIERGHPEKQPLQQDSGKGHAEKQPAAGRPVIAVAKDEAFSFIYRENLQVLEQCGAELRFFSPLRDSALPEGINGLILSGGYPEYYREALMKNHKLIRELRSRIAAGMPVIAECGGFMYLQDMTGILPGECHDTGHLVRFGYLLMKTVKDGLYGPAGTVLRGHSFHHYDSTENGEDCLIIKPAAGNGALAVSEKTWKEMVYTETIAAGWPHFYYPGCRRAVTAFLARCALGELLNGETEWDD